MRVLRSGVVAVLVAFLTTCGLVATSARADTTNADCFNVFLCGDGRPFDPVGNLKDGLSIIGKGVDWAGSLGGLLPNPMGTEPCPYYVGTEKQGQPCKYVEAYLPYTPGGAAKVKQLGTSSEVKAGSAMESGLCGSGSGCYSLLTGLGLFGHGGPEDVLPDGQDPKTGAINGFGPGRFYPATNNTAGPWGYLTVVEDGVDYMKDVHHAPTINSGDSVCFNTQGTANSSSYNMTVTWRASLVRKDIPGQWIHMGGHVTYSASNQRLVGTCVDPSSSSYDGSQYELRSFQIVGDRPLSGDELSETSNGYAWGQDFFPDDARIRSTVRCTGPSGDHDVVGEAVLLSLHQVVTPSCPPGEHPLWNQLDVVGSDGTVTPQSITNLRPGWDPTTTPADKSPFPLCTNGSCVWIIKVGDTWCAKGVAGCVDWASNPGQAKCFLGPYELPLTRCGWLERAYELTDPATIPATVPNGDGDPNTSEGPRRNPATDPAAQPAPGPTVDPSPDPTGDPGGTPTPTPTGTGSPEPCTSGQACSDPPPDPQDSECFPTGWGAFNPVEWVKKPVGCALREAFIPDPQVVTDVTSTIRTSVDTSGAGPIVDAIGAPIGTLSSASGCSGIEFDLPIGGQSFHGSILNACSGPMATAAHICSVLIGLGSVVFGGMALLRLAGAGFGYNVKPTDGD